MSLPQIDRDFGLEAKLQAIKLSAIPLAQASRIAPTNLPKLLLATHVFRLAFK